ncbi:MFS transporter [Raoultella planticola]|uniref:hypothetical protein n=1 Tax=Raoultella planticola TaxID=575 RepID=UPI001D0D40A7|nr:hypothetical protein [Raoultella planticola]
MAIPHLAAFLSRDVPWPEPGAAILFLFSAAGMLVNSAVADWAMKRGADKMKSRKCMTCLGLLCAAGFTLPTAYTDSMFMAVACISMALFSIHFASTSAWGLILDNTGSFTWRC